MNDQLLDARIREAARAYVAAVDAERKCACPSHRYVLGMRERDLRASLAELPQAETGMRGG